ncbi:hypothetical protein Q4F19_17270 [Sphingomonas sp. BIUV-7]|uniref:Uncharacterized protein n=1 Tax=Sphingomonas natans TaxID=3063330 RepID=A0ABT8YCT3_9SPHN|nr:hypothetical protein [Sphingomonas sp. BIUV-7]MDO6416140.1 hypothetical protein [Sphingomonas sp. BIUV-7]
MQAIETVFEGGTIDLKDGVFTRCAFKDCLLLAEGGGFLFVGSIRFVGAIRVRTGKNKSAQGQILSEWHRTAGEGSLTFEDG